MKLGDVARHLGGEIAGDPDIDIRGAAGIHDAGEGELTFLADRKLIEPCAGSRASGVVVKQFVPELGKPQIIVANPLYAFAKLLELFHVKPALPTGISGSAFVSPQATIGKDVSVHAFAYVSGGAVLGDRTTIHPGAFIGADSVVGEECVIYPNVTVREGVIIGNRVIIHAGSVLGSDGFGYVFDGGRHYKIPQVGTVVIGDDVEIGANVTIDRATTGKTSIGKGTKIDNLVQVGHNVRIGEHSIIVAQVGIGGSTEIGSHVVLGGQVGIADHAILDDGCMVGAKGGVMGHLPKGIYSGAPVIPHREWLKASALFARLPELHKRIRELEEKLSGMEKEAE
jgi:UDP-3-O-[3-hydroxymyristoyl] glucosamine N-acyltransferase